MSLTGFFLFVLTGNVFGKDTKTTEFERIRHSEEYVCGLGIGETLQDAQEMAVKELASQISISVSVNYAHQYEETEEEFHDRVKSNMESFTGVTLNNAKSLVDKVESKGNIQWQVLRYISKKDIEKAFQDRTKKLMDYLKQGQKAENSLKIDDALRDYYWSMALLQTLPHNGSVKALIGDDSIALAVWLPEHISTMMGNLKIDRVSGTDSECELCFLYNEQPVSTLHFTYFDGVDISSLYGVRDGRCVIELRPGVSSDNIDVYYEYAFENQAHIDREVEMAMKSFSKPVRFTTATDRVQVTDPQAVKKSKKKNKDAAENAIALETTSSIICNSMESIETDALSQAMETVFQSIRSGNYDSSESCFTPEGWKVFQSIIHYGNARLFNSMKPTDYVFIQYGEKVICRSIPMVFSFSNNIRKFTENVTFTFNAEGKIENLAFSLGQEAERDILTKGTWTPQARMAIMNFLEDYKTAFALKDIDYIRSVFDEHAVIIVGKMVRPTADLELKTTLGDNVAEYARLTKEEYMQRLERSFTSNEFINIHFANNDVQKAQNSEVYGIQIKQDYYSSNYGDTGYLFLIVELYEPDKPLIKVRTWQPDPDPNFGVFSLGDF